MSISSDNFYKVLKTLDSINEDKEKVKCEHCGGSGYHGDKKCHKCNGTGKVVVNEDNTRIEKQGEKIVVTKDGDRTEFDDEETASMFIGNNMTNEDAESTGPITNQIIEIAKQAFDATDDKVILKTVDNVKELIEIPIGHIITANTPKEFKVSQWEMNELNSEFREMLGGELNKHIEKILYVWRNNQTYVQIFIKSFEAADVIPDELKRRVQDWYSQNIDNFQYEPTMSEIVDKLISIGFNFEGNDPNTVVKSALGHLPIEEEQTKDPVRLSALSNKMLGEEELPEFDSENACHRKRLQRGTPVVLDQNLCDKGKECCSGIFIKLAPSGNFGKVLRDCDGKEISIHIDDIKKADILNNAIYEGFASDLELLLNEEITVTSTDNVENPDNNTTTVTAVGKESVDELEYILRNAGIVHDPTDNMDYDAEYDPNIEYEPEEDDIVNMPPEPLDTDAVEIPDLHEELTNSPDEEEFDVKTVTRGTSGGLNKPKRHYRKEYPGDNVMAANLDEVGKDIKEEQLDEKSPPGMEDWVKKNKERFIDKYGKEKGLEVLYSTAWKRHNAKEDVQKDGAPLDEEVESFFNLYKVFQQNK